MKLSNIKYRQNQYANIKGIKTKRKTNKMFLTISRRQVIAVANSVVLTYFDQIQFLKATKFIFQTHRH